MNTDVISTRCTYRGPGTVPRKTRVANSRTGGGSADGAIFYRLVRDLIRAPRREREAARGKVVEHLRTSRDPVRAVNQMLFECATAGGTDGLDIAIDVLAEVGSLSANVAIEYLRKDLPNWRDGNSLRSVSGDVWYSLLRGLCRSGVASTTRASVVISAALRGTAAIREATIQALGDLAEHSPCSCESAKSLLRTMATNDQSPAVRASATEALRDLEG